MSIVFRNQNHFRLYLTPASMTVIAKTKQSKDWQECGGVGGEPFQMVGGMLVQPPWKP